MAKEKPKFKILATMTEREIVGQFASREINKTIRRVSITLAVLICGIIGSMIFNNSSLGMMFTVLTLFVFLLWYYVCYRTANIKWRKIKTNEWPIDLDKA